MKKTVQAVAMPLSRRSFLVSVGGVAVAVMLGSASDTAWGAMPTLEANGEYKPNVWVTIDEDGIVTIVSPASEMGQGAMTTLPLLIAEDMDADWEKVRIVQGPADAKKFGNPRFYGIQLTGGSETTPGYYEALRLVGAQTRKVLIASAAQIWGVEAEELSTEPNVILHKATGRTLGFGDIARTGKLPASLPSATKDDLKPAEQWRLIGNVDVPRVDVPQKVDGSAKFGIDVQLPNMLFGAVLRAPVPGERPEAFDDKAAKAVPGIKHIVRLDYGIGLIGETVEATLRAKDLLEVNWSRSSRVRSYSSRELIEDYRQISHDRSKSGVSMLEHGDASKALAGASRTIAADYLVDHVYHATMEPMNATALIANGRVGVWAPTQSPTRTQAAAARIVDTTPDKVDVHTTFLGGGFGRRGEVDFVIDAVSLAKITPGKPVKVIWSREDDTRHGMYRPLAAQHIEVGLDEHNTIVGWRHRVVADSIFARVMPQLFEKANGKDSVVTEGANFNYAIPAHTVEYVRQDKGQPVGFWRAVGVGYTKFAIECVVDEIATTIAVDPLDLRLELLKDQPRALHVLNTVAKMAEWGRSREGRALGLAYSDAWHAHCAQIAEVSLDRDSGEIRVHKVWCVVDPGVAVQPRNIKAQMVSGITHGVSHALFEQLNIDKGEVEEANFDTYRILRMSEAPEIEVEVIPTPENKPAGIGEVGLPPVGPAIANAIAKLTGGVRLRHYPFLPDRVKAALDS